MSPSHKAGSQRNPVPTSPSVPPTSAANSSLPGGRKLWLILIPIVVILACLPALQNGFVYDDRGLIVDRKSVMEQPGGLQALLSHDFWWGSPMPSASKTYLYRPWVTATYWADYHLGGGSAAMFHASNLLVHAANSLLVFLLMETVTGSAMALVIALLFGLSPGAVTSVGWIAGRTDLWATFFSLISLLTFRKAVSGQNRWMLSASLTSFFFALCSKEIAIITPVLALGLEYVSPSRTVKEGSPVKGGRNYALWAAPVILFWIIRRVVIGSALPQRMGLDSVLSILPFLAEKVLRTISHVLFPVGYSFYSEYLWSKPEQRGIMFAVVWLAFIAFAVFAIRGFSRRKLWAVGGLWMGLTLLPVYAFGQSFAPIADFYAYMGLPGLWLFVADGLRSLSLKYGLDDARTSRVASYTFPAVALIFAVLLFVRLPILKSEQTLIAHMLIREPGSTMAMSMQADLALNGSDPVQAKRWMEEAVARDPHALKPRCGLANLLLDQGDVNGAAPHVDALAEYGALDVGAQSVIARFYYVAGHCPEAVTTYQKAATMGQLTEDALYGFGLALLCVNENQEALSIYQEALKRKPQWAEAYNNLGICYENLGQFPEAVKAYSEAVRIKPDLAAGWESLAVVSLKQGNTADAQRAADAYFKLNPPPERAERLRAQLAAGAAR